MIVRAMIGSIVLGAAALAAGYALEGGWNDARIVTAAGLVWLLVEQKRWAWPSSIAFVFFVAMAGRGLWLGIRPLPALISVVAVLSAWDLAYFRLRLQGVQATASQRMLERQHLSRLLLADGAATLLGVIALDLRIRLGVGSALLLGALAVAGLSQAIRFLRRNSE